ncbi:MAG: hypothetical protein JO291_01120 [Acidimicrobiia bacterium]|nr:hypothetical protein [Acidimicrobiia bacterium]
MILGDGLRPADGAASAEWIGEALRGPDGTVGGLVPDRYPAILRVHAPEPALEEWWAEYRALYELVASIGERHTSTPDRAWFGVWEGHGFDNTTTHIAWWDPPPDEGARRARLAEQARLREEDQRRNAAIRAALAELPRFDRPNRTYFLLEGPVAGVSRLHDPGLRDWRNPDLFWPDDRRWFVATDVDFWSLYIGGEDDFLAEVAASVPTPSESVPPDRLLEIED